MMLLCSRIDSTADKIRENSSKMVLVPLATTFCMCCCMALAEVSSVKDQSGRNYKKVFLRFGVFLHFVTETADAGPEVSPSPPRPPNIVFILVDDVGWADFGYNSPGYSSIPTPNIDRLAKQA